MWAKKKKKKQKKKQRKTIAIERHMVCYVIVLDKFSWLPVWSDGPVKCHKKMSSTINTFA